jgi:hypothetical protein
MITELPAITIGALVEVGSGRSDDFNRADGSFGANWSGFGAGAMAISSKAAVGTSGGATTGRPGALRPLAVTSTPRIR